MSIDSKNAGITVGGLDVLWREAQENLRRADDAQRAAEDVLRVAQLARKHAHAFERSLGMMLTNVAQAARET